MTFGHMSLIKRGLDLFDHIIVAVARNSAKNPLFTIDERVALAQEIFQDEPRVTVEPFYGLLVKYVADRGCNAILRGLRAVSDFEYEFQMALMNRRLNHGIQTVFLMTDYRWLYISSTIVKEAARFGGDIRGVVPDVVYFRMMEKYGLDMDGNGKGFKDIRA